MIRSRCGSGFVLDAIPFAKFTDTEVLSLRYDRRSNDAAKCELAVDHDELKAGLGLLDHALGTRHGQ
jgi:hypothetical protein